MRDEAGARGEATRPALVGRDAELERLDVHLAAAVSGRGSLVAVSGPAGIGKTALGERLADRAAAAGLTVVWGRCWSAGGAPPLWPWQEVFDGLGVADAVDLLDRDRGSTDVDPDRFARFVAVAEHLADVVHRRGACVLIEDAHEADAGTLLLARFLARSVDRMPLLLVVTHRSGATDGRPDVAALLDDLDQAADVVALDHLDTEAIGELLRSRGVDRLPTDVLTAIEGLSRGNPLFLDRLVSSGALRAGDELPTGLRRAIAQSVARLEPATQAALRHAAILGPNPSIAESAVLARCEPAAMLDHAAKAQAVGLVGRTGRGRLTFSHDLVREVLIDGLSPAETLDAHARAVDLVAGSADEPTVSRLTRRAHHATRAATRSTVDAARAVAIARDAARAMVGAFGYEQAADLLATASRIHADARLADGAALHVEEAQAVLLAGRLAEARVLFDRAAEGAERESEPLLLAEAALGLGGVWVNQHRAPDERQRIRALQKRALAGLPSGQDALESRLRTRLAAEGVYAGQPLDHAFACLDESRRVGDARALAEALSLTHHVLLTPEHTWERLPLADELIRVASADGLGVLALMGLCWRTVDLFLLGEPSAERALADLRERSDAIGCRSIQYMVGVHDVMLTIRDGRLDEAESAALSVFELGAEVGDVDAIAYLGAHLVAIRWLQGRESEALDLVTDVAASPTLIDAELTFPALESLFAARTGDTGRARAVLDRLSAPGLASVPRSSTWLSAMLAVIESARALDDAAVAAEAADLLAPFASLPIRPSLAVVCLGSVERPLGLAALVAGDAASAVEHLEAALNANLRLGNRPVNAIARADLADALLARGLPGDEGRGAEHLRRALAEAETMGMDGWVERWRDRLGEIGKERGGSTVTSGTSRVFRRSGTRWEVGTLDRSVMVDDMVGLGHLARLVAQPGVDVPAVVLASGGEQVPDPSRQDVADDTARTAYEERALVLVDELGEARAAGDPDQVARLEAEVDALTVELERTRGLSGRRRAFAGPDERARTAVRKAIKRAIDELDAADPALGSHLRRAVRTGFVCTYDPQAPVHWVLT